MTRDEYMREVEFVKNELKGCQDEVVFSHNDCWWSNQIYNKEKGKTN